MISLVYSAGLRRSELLNLTPQDINSETMSVRIMGKGKKCRYSLLSPKLLEELRHYFREYRPQKWLFEGETPGEQYSASALVKVLKEAAHRAGIKHRVHVHMLRHSFATHLAGTGEQTCTRYRNCWDTTTSRPQPFIFMCQVPIKQKSLILLIHWIIREVQL